MADSIDRKVPDLGDFADVEVIEVLVKAGDRIAREDGLITLETDKASMDVPATDHGVIEELTVAVGDRVSSGDVIGRLRGQRFVFDSDAYHKLLGSAWYSSEKIEQELGFRPSRGLRDGVEEMVRGFRETGNGSPGPTVT